MYPTGEVRREKINPILLGAQECIEDGKVWMGEMGWTHQSGVSGGSSCWPCSSSPQLYKESEMFRKEGKEHLRTKESAKCSQMPKKSLGKKSLYLKRKIKVFSLVWMIKQLFPSLISMTSYLCVEIQTPLKLMMKLPLNSRSQAFICSVWRELLLILKVLSAIWGISSCHKSYCCLPSTASTIPFKKRYVEI